MPYYGFIIYFKLKRFARLEISTSVINTIITGKKEVGFFSCNDCIYHRCGYFKPCKSFQFKVTFTVTFNSI